MPKLVAHIEAIISIGCCDVPLGSSDASATADVPADSGGRELHKAVCDRCGSEYMFGVIARTREQSLADEAFEEVSAEKLDEIGVDRSDLEPSAEDVAMCARCDGDVDRSTDYCAGCREYVHLGCRTREPRRAARHAAEEHWEVPKTELADSSSRAAEDDGSTFDGDDFVAED